MEIFIAYLAKPSVYLAIFLRQYSVSKFSDFPLEKSIPIISDHYEHTQFFKTTDADHNKTPEPSSSAPFSTAKKNETLFPKMIQNRFIFKTKIRDI